MISAIVFYALIIFGLRRISGSGGYFIIDNLLTLIGGIKLYFLPLFAGNFLITTSDEIIIFITSHDHEFLNNTVDKILDVSKYNFTNK